MTDLGMSATATCSTWFDGTGTRTSTAVTYLAVGFGAHHWRAEVQGEPRLFVSLDMPLPRHTPASLEAAYASAAALAETLDFVWPSLPSTVDGTLHRAARHRPPQRHPLAGRARRPEAGTTDLAPLLDQLHAATAPDRACEWVSTVDHHLPDQLDLLVEEPWENGPLGEQARALVSPRLSQVRDWSEEHAGHLETIDRDGFVVTHGEPGEHNQWVADGRTYLLDWESLLLAPAERDLGTLVQSGIEAERADPDLVRFFDLEWRLAEIQAFTPWLAGPHDDDEDAQVALGGLRHELTRPPVDPDPVRRHGICVFGHEILMTLLPVAYVNGPPPPEE